MRAETAATKQLTPMIARQTRRLIAAFSKDGIAGIDDPQIVTVNTDEMALALTRLYETVMPRFADQIFEEAAKDTAGIYRQLQDNWIAANTLKSITIEDNIRAAVRSALLRGLDQGLGTAAIAREINKLVPQFSRVRARRISRTEVNASASAASDFAAEATAIPLEREWLAVDDDRTRESHDAADGQRRGMREPFDVGGSELMRPSDPSGPPEETINCRCSVLYHRTAI